MPFGGPLTVGLIGAGTGIAKFYPQFPQIPHLTPTLREGLQLWLMKELSSYRQALRLSQSRLARISGVSRFKICVFELGDGELSPEDQSKIREALQAEADRLRNLATTINFGSAPEGQAA